MKILIVDDEKDILEFLSYNLSKEGYDVSTASNGEIGLKQAIKFKPDLIILDVMMPEMDGVTTCKEIKKTPGLESTLILFLTARSEEYSELAGFDAGADDYVTKPIKPKLLIFDEPFSGFDPINANLIKDEILKLRDNGATIIFSTHRMESVEELCEDIALINKSNKILDGKLDDIKRKFKSNTFEVGVYSSNLDLLNKELESKYEISSPSFRTIGDNLKLNVKLKNNQNSEDLLKLLNQNSKVIHFKEVIPSANDIFINSIENN